MLRRQRNVNGKSLQVPSRVSDEKPVAAAAPAWAAGHRDRLDPSPALGETHKFTRTHHPPTSHPLPIISLIQLCFRHTLEVFTPGL